MHHLTYLSVIKQKKEREGRDEAENEIWRTRECGVGETPLWEFAEKAKGTSSVVKAIYISHELIETTLRLQILLYLEDITINSYNKRKWLFRTIAFKFPARRHLGFYDITELTTVSNKRTSAFQQQRHPSDVIKSKMANCGRFKSGNLFRLLLLLNVIISLFW